MSFIEIDFMSAMRMLEEGEIENLYFWIGGSMQPTKNYKSDYSSLKDTQYFKRIVRS